MFPYFCKLKKMMLVFLAGTKKHTSLGSYVELIDGENKI
jgi:hypothetical protein